MRRDAWLIVAAIVGMVIAIPAAFYLLPSPDENAERERILVRLKTLERENTELRSAVSSKDREIVRLEGAKKMSETTLKTTKEINTNLNELEKTLRDNILEVEKERDELQSQLDDCNLRVGANNSD